MRDIIIYATETMADWEYAYLTTEVVGAESVHPGRFRVLFAGETAAPVRTLGGLSITPDTTVAGVDLDSAAALVLPGGQTWGEGHDAVLSLATQAVEAGVPLGAICGATFGIARVGLLDAIPHTSNDPSFLGQSGYAGSSLYEFREAVTAGGVTTASGLRPVPFTAEILVAAGVLPAEYANAWRELNASPTLANYEEYVRQGEAFAAATPPERP